MDVDRAVVAARNAYESPSPWSAMTPRERSHLLWRIGDLIDAHADEFAQLEALDNGKRVEAARDGDVATAAELFRYFAGWATKMEGTTIPMSVPGRSFHAYTRREPVGVVAGIVPWNFPLLMACFKIVPALAAGNTVVLKPAEQTPLTALRLGELLLEAGVPAGVVNVVPGYGDRAPRSSTTRASTRSPSPAAPRSARRSPRQPRGNLKKVSLELGGKAPNIIFADADLDAAVAGAALGGYFNEGQCCVNGSPALRRSARSSTRSSRVSPRPRKARSRSATASTRPDHGPAGLAGAAREGHGLRQRRGPQGATICRRQRRPRRRPGLLLLPDADHRRHREMAVQTDEIFGPVITAIPFDTEDEVVAAANNTVYGLAAGVWSKDLGTAHRVG